MITKLFLSQKRMFWHNLGCIASPMLYQMLVSWQCVPSVWKPVLSVSNITVQTIIEFVQAKKDYNVWMLLYFYYQTQRDGSRIYGLFKEADAANPEQYQYTLRLKATNMWTCGLLFSFFGSDGVGGLTDSEMSNLLNNLTPTGTVKSRTEKAPSFTL